MAELLVLGTVRHADPVFSRPPRLVQSCLDTEVRPRLHGVVFVICPEKQMTEILFNVHNIGYISQGIAFILRMDP